MPELPEVEIVARQLDERIRGRVIDRVEVLNKKSFQGDAKDLCGRKIARVFRRAKMVVLEFDGWEMVLLVHLKMTGQLVWRLKSWNVNHLKRGVVGGHPARDWVGELPNKHTRVIFNLVDGSRLFFNDMRIFGWVRVLSGDDWRKIENELPPDVVDESFSLGYLMRVLSKSARLVKLVIMDSAKIGGVGNIYANDALNLAKICPRRRANSLTKKEVGLLHAAIKEVMRRGIRYGGATYSDFRDTQGLGGKYQDHFLVYNREGGVCPNCGGEIVKTKIGGRGTYYCPKCQV